MKLSVLVSSIRTERLKNLYDSIKQSFSGEFELIVISPYDLPWVMKDIYNVKLIKSFRSPCACQQQGLLEATGDWLAWSSDDCTYLPNAIDDSFKLLEGKDENTIIVSKYLEGDEPISMDSDAYYYLRFHESMRLKGIPDNAMLLNCGLVSRKLLLELGGWDSSKFEVLPLAYTDFSLRALKYGAKFIIQKNAVCSCTHMPGMTGDHGPIHTAQTFRDMPMFNMLYCKPTDRMIIDVNNWQKSPELWGRRFKK